jgi:hypothetical protein
MEVKPKKCANVDCDNVFTPKYRTTERTCCYTCEKAYQDSKPQKEQKQYKIPRVSKKRSKDEKIYTARRIVFLSKPENKLCPITGEKTTEVHHKKGRVGSLFLDETFWLAVSRKGHQMIEENPEWAKENGYSLNRL